MDEGWRVPVGVGARGRVRSARALTCEFEPSRGRATFAWCHYCEDPAHDRQHGRAVALGLGLGQVGAQGLGASLVGFIRDFD